MYTSSSSVLVFVAMFAFLIWKILGKRIIAQWKARSQVQVDFIKNPKSFSRLYYRKELQRQWKLRNDSISRNAKEQFRNVCQIEGVLVAPFMLQKDMVYIELMGNMVTLFKQDEPSVSMYIHPQDTILEVMEKFGVGIDSVLVHKDKHLGDLDKTLMESGIPDNCKIYLCVEPKQPQNIDELF